MKKQLKKGFTLTELVIVIVIIAILAAVLIPSMTGYVNRAKKSNATQEAASTYTVLSAWLVDSSDKYGYEKASDGDGILKTAAVEAKAAEYTKLTDSTAPEGFTTATSGYYTYDDTTKKYTEISSVQTYEANKYYTLKTPAVEAKDAEYYSIKEAFELYLAEASDCDVDDLKTTVVSVSVTNNAKTAKVVIKSSNKFYVTINYADGNVTYTDPTTEAQA